MKNKIFITLLITFVAAIFLVVGVSAAARMNLIVDGQLFSGKQKVVDGVTYFPLRDLANLLEAKIHYDDSTKTISLMNKSDIVEPSSIKFIPYKNDSFKFQFSYPENWVLKESLGGDILIVSVGSSEQPQNSEIIITMKQPKDTEWLNMFMDGFDNRISDQKVKFGSTTARKVVTNSTRGEMIHYGIETNDKSIWLFVVGGTSLENYYLNKIMESMHFN